MHSGIQNMKQNFPVARTFCHMVFKTEVKTKHQLTTANPSHLIESLEIATIEVISRDSIDKGSMTLSITTFSNSESLKNDMGAGDWNLYI